MKAVGKPGRARGGNRGGTGGGYERTDPDYSHKRLARLKAEYADVEEEWRGTFLGGLTRFEQDFVQGRRRGGADGG